MDIRNILEDRRPPIQSAEFYSQKGLEREYYYVIDIRGQLFLESTKRHTMATCMKDKAFLKFFYNQMRPNLDPSKLQFPYVSPCGKEKNYVTPQDPMSALVFIGLDSSEENLEYAFGTLKEKFEPSKLTMSLSTMRIYHPIIHHKRLNNLLGLIHPHLCQLLASNIKAESPPAGSDESKYCLDWKGSKYPVEIID